MHCKRCNAELKSEYNICPNCGLEISKEEQKEGKTWIFNLIRGVIGALCIIIAILMKFSVLSIVLSIVSYIGLSILLYCSYRVVRLRFLRSNICSIIVASILILIMVSIFEHGEYSLGGAFLLLFLFFIPSIFVVNLILDIILKNLLYKNK